jgi:lactobin A/cerein 7B family class IIb bacteriocin
MRTISKEQLSSVNGGVGTHVGSIAVVGATILALAAAASVVGNETFYGNSISTYVNSFFRNFTNSTI